MRKLARVIRRRRSFGGIAPLPKDQITGNLKHFQRKSTTPISWKLACLNQKYLLPFCERRRTEKVKMRSREDGETRRVFSDVGGSAEGKQPRKYIKDSIPLPLFWATLSFVLRLACKPRRRRKSFPVWADVSWSSTVSSSSSPSTIRHRWTCIRNSFTTKFHSGIKKCKWFTMN